MFNYINKIALVEPLTIAKVGGSSASLVHIKASIRGNSDSIGSMLTLIGTKLVLLTGVSCPIFRLVRKAMQLPDKKARLNLNRFLPYRLTTLSNKMSHELTELYSSKFGLSIQEWQILMVLGEHEELLAVEICSLTAMYKVAVSRAVKKLLSKNLLFKNQSEEDNRRFTLSLSNEGKKLYAKVGSIAVNYEAEIIASLSAAEIEAMDQLFTQLDGILEGIELG